LQYEGVCFESESVVVTKVSRVEFEALTALAMKNTVFSVLKSCSLEGTQYFEGMLPPSSGTKSRPSEKPSEAGGLLFDP
jgi:hypothetical protein